MLVCRMLFAALTMPWPKRRVPMVAGMIIHALAAASCTQSKSDALDHGGSAQAMAMLQVKSVAAAEGAEVYELDQARGVLFKTSGTFAAGTKLVALPWGEWDIVRTDPIRVVPQALLSASEGQCPLTVYPFHRFYAGQSFVLDGNRLQAAATAQERRALIFGNHFAMADSAIGLVATSAYTLSPAKPSGTGLWHDPTSIPRPLDMWFAQLNVPTEAVDPMIDDNAFLDFAACYLELQPELMPSDIIFGAYRVLLPNGSSAVLSYPSSKTQPTEGRFDSSLYEIDRDVLHFGLVAASRRITLPHNGSTVLVSKRYFGLEKQALFSSSAYTSAGSAEKDSLVQSVISDLASTEVGWKMALFELLVNEQDRAGLTNQIFTGAGQVALIDHEAVDPFGTAVPCAVGNLPLSVSITPELQALYAERRYREFENRTFLVTTRRVMVDDTGTVYNALQSYGHLAQTPVALPPSLLPRLQWILDNRASTEVRLADFFRTWAEFKGLDAEATSESGVCVFYERLQWVHDQQRLPTEAEGTAIMQRCGLQPKRSCHLAF